MMANIVNQYSSTIITIFTDVVKKYESNLEVIEQTEGELQDLFHEIELSSPKDMYGGYKLYKAIRELRVRRRTAKDENSLLKDMYDYIKGQNGQAVKSKLQSIQGSSAKVYDAQQKRTYTPRQRTDLTITEKTCDVNKPFEDLLRDFNKNKATMRGGKMRK